MLGIFLHLTVLHQTEWLFALLVQLDNLLGTVGSDGFEVGSQILVRRVGDEASQDIYLKLIELSIYGFEHGILRRHLAACLHIVIHLVIEAALQLGTHTCQFLRIERDVLIACSIGTHTHEVLHPGGTAELSAARTGSTDSARLLARTNLFHLDAYVEGLGKHLDELAEIHTLIGDIVEYRLVAISLVLHVANLHLQAKDLGYLAALDHGGVLTAFRLLPLVEIHLLGNAVDALDIILRLEVCLLDLQLHESAGECNHANVMTRICFHGHDVALSQVEVIHIVIISFSGILELHLYEVGAFSVSWHVGKPVVCVELFVLSSHSFIT